MPLHHVLAHFHANQPIGLRQLGLEGCASHFAGEARAVLCAFDCDSIAAGGKRPLACLRIERAIQPHALARVAIDARRGERHKHDNANQQPFAHVHPP